MNTNDFYKELFERYALDEEKIRKNAIKAAKTPAWQRTLGAHWKSAVGAAAAVAVTVGAVAYTVGNNTANIDINGSSDLLTAAQRLHEAEQNYYNAATKGENSTYIYVSFSENMSFGDLSVALSAVTESEDIVIECLYLSDPAVIRGRADIEAYAETSGSLKNIAGAKLFAPEKCYRDIQDLSAVYLAELESEDINDETFSPIDLSDEDPLNDSEIITTTAMPTETTTPFSFAVETTSASISAVYTDISDDTTDEPEDTEVPETDDEPEDTEIPDVTENTDNTEETEDSEESDADTTTVPEESDISSETGSDTAAETTVPASDIEDAPDVGLMTQIYQLNVENALETLLVRDTAVVLTRGEAYFYQLGGIMERTPYVAEISNPKIAYSDESSVILTGCGSNGLRNVIAVFDTKNFSIELTELADSLGDADIGTINRAEDKCFLKAVSASKTYLYELTAASGGIQLRPLFEYTGAVSPAGYKNGRLWFAALNEDMKYDLYSFDCANGSLRKEQSFGSDCRIRRSRTFESFAILTSNSETGQTITYVYDVTTSALISVNVEGEVSVAVRSGVIYISAGGKNYSVSSDGTLTETSAPVNFGSRTSSPYSIISSDSEKIVVAKEHEWHN